MKRNYWEFYIMLALVLASCKTTRNNSEPNFDISRHGIVSKFKAQVDPSVDIKILKDQYKKYPDRWETAYKFLGETNLDSLPYGTYHLNDDVYVKYAKGITKDLKDCKYERHERWIDLQYMVEGEEYMGKNTNYKQLKVMQPYNEKKDVELFEYDGKPLKLANPKNYFIFFPTEAHIPTVCVGEIKETRKLVVKIKYN